MALSLDGTTGITSDGGTPVIENLDTTATGIAVTGQLTTTGNVGVGTSSPTNKLHAFSSSTTATVAKFGANNYGNTGTTYVEIGTQYGDGGSRIGNINPSGNLGTLVFETMTGTSGVFAERMRIDSAGRVTMPYQPAFRAHRATTTWESYSVQTVIWNTATLNTGNHFNTTNGTFTAPVNGLYYLHFAAYQLNTNPSGSAYIYVNGLPDNIYRYSLTQENTATDMTNHVIVLQPLLAGDSVTTLVSGDLYTGHSSFSGYLIG